MHRELERARPAGTHRTSDDSLLGVGSPPTARAAKTHRALLADLAVARVQDHVPRVRVDADQPVISQSTPVSSFVSRTAASRSISPESIAPPGNAQLSLSERRITSSRPSLVGDRDVDRRHEAVRRRRLRIVEVVDPPSHAYAPPRARAGDSASGRAVCPHALEARHVVIEQPPAREAPQVQHRRLPRRARRTRALLTSSSSS